MRARFGSDPSITGRIIRFEEAQVQIIGVLPQDFIYPTQATSGELLLVARPQEDDAINPHATVLSPVARLEPGASIEQAQSEIDVIVRQALRRLPEQTQDGILRISNLQYALFELSRPILWLLVGAALFVLLIACVNLAALLIARGSARQQEIHIRMAVGASRGRIVRQLLVESIVLASIGGAVALVAAVLTFGLLRQYVPESYRIVPDSLDGRAFMFTGIISLACGCLFGLLPAVRLSALDLTSGIGEGGRVQRPFGGLLRAGPPLVAVEVTLAMMLFTGTGLTVNSLIRMRAVELGFDPGQTLVVNVDLPMTHYPEPTARYEYVQQLLERVRRLPGVQVAGAIQYLEVGRARPPAGLPDHGLADAGVWRVTPGYFAAMGIPLLRGRDFTAQESGSNAAVGIVNESVARYFWLNAPAIGRQLRVDRDVSITVIGVAKDVRPGYGRPVRPSIYRPMSARHAGQTIVVRSVGDRPLLAMALRTEAQRLEPKALVSPPVPLKTTLGEGIRNVQFETLLFVVFGVLGLVVAAIGVYGLVSFWVAGRTREMGVRIALGARAIDLHVLVMRQTVAPLLVGLACGLAGALVFARQLASLLYGIRPDDPATVATVTIALLGVGITAAYFPARRVSRVDPLVALRTE